MDGKRRTVDLDENSFKKATQPAVDNGASADRENADVAQTGSRREDEL